MPETILTPAPLASPFGFQIDAAGHYRGRIESFSRTTHLYSMTLYVDGRGTQVRDGVAYKNFGAGTFVVTRPGQRVEVVPERGAPLEAFWVSFSGPSAAACYSQFRDGAADLVFQVAPIPEWRAPFVSMLGDLKTGLPERLFLADSRMLTLFLSALQAHRLRSAGQKGDAVNDFVHFVESRLEEDRLDLDAYIASCGLPYETFRKRFRRELGQSPHEYWLMAKITRAKRLLLETSGTADSIADELGFSSPTYFSRIFKHKTGLSPSAFRRTPRLI